jgi:hypothetical protein
VHGVGAPSLVESPSLLKGWVASRVKLRTKTDRTRSDQTSRARRRELAASITITITIVTSKAVEAAR